jgi:DNA-binding response OmpR family regulator
VPKILIVEDDLMIADMVELALIEHGYEVCGVACNVTDALALVRQHNPDLAIIDLRLADGELGTEVVAKLGGLGSLGVLYATGNKSKLSGVDGHACISKPYRDIDLVRGLEIVAEIMATGTASPPFPRGFEVLTRSSSKQEPSLVKHT